MRRLLSRRSPSPSIPASYPASGPLSTALMNSPRTGKRAHKVDGRSVRLVIGRFLLTSRQPRPWHCSKEPTAVATHRVNVPVAATAVSPPCGILPRPGPLSTARMNPPPGRASKHATADGRCVWVVICALPLLRDSPARCLSHANLQPWPPAATGKTAFTNMAFPKA